MGNIKISALRKADIILTTGDHKVSAVIRNAIGSDVSHSMIYLGNQEVIEAVEPVVERHTWEVASAEATLAIALRRRNMDQTARDAVVETALQYKGKPYDYIGAVGSGMYGDRRGSVLTAAACTVLPIGCAIAQSEITKNASDQNADNKFFCSELVSRAFTAAGYPIVDGRATDTTPAAIRVSSYLMYVGHLIGG